MLVLGMGGMYGFPFLIYGYVPVKRIQPIPVVFTEMPLYFGYSLNKIGENTNNKFLSIGYPMFFYTLQLSFIPLIFDWKHLILRFLSFLPLMIVLGIIFYKKRKLVSFMIGHSILDLATGAQIVMTSISPAIFEMMKNMSSKM